MPVRAKTSVSGVTLWLSAFGTCSCFRPREGVVRRCGARSCDAKIGRLFESTGKMTNSACAFGRSETCLAIIATWPLTAPRFRQTRWISRASREGARGSGSASGCSTTKPTRSADGSCHESGFTTTFGPNPAGGSGGQLASNAAWPVFVTEVKEELILFAVVNVRSEATKRPQ